MGQTRWEPPGKLTEPAGSQLAAFGVTSLPGARINTIDPPVSSAQQRLMGAELRRRREGKRTRTGMSETQLRKFASTKHKNLPKRVG